MRKLHILAAIFLLSSFSVFIFMLNKHREEVRYKQHIIHKEAIALKKIYVAIILELTNIEPSEVLQMSSTNLKDIARIGYNNEFNEIIDISDNYIFCDNMNLWVNSAKSIYTSPSDIAISKYVADKMISIRFDYSIIIKQLNDNEIK